LRLLRNVMEGLPPAIAIRLRGHKSNSDGIGAAVTVETELGRQTRILQAGSGFLSQHSKEIFFGLGAAKGPVKVSICWPSGLVQELDAIPLNHRVWVEEGLDSHRMEPFRRRQPLAAKSQETELLPDTAETWLLVPVAAPGILNLSSLRGKPALLPLAMKPMMDEKPISGVQLLRVDVDENADAAGAYNVLYRYLFDRHRDLSLPASFLIDENGDIVKIYQRPVDPRRLEQDIQRIPRNHAERLAKALPFAGVANTYEFARNNLSLGTVFFQRGYFDQAAESFRLALRDDPSSAEALYGLGSVFLKLDKTSEARESFERAAGLPAGYPETRPNAFNNLGLLATREGRIDDAIGYFQEALRASPDHLIALENLGNAYRQQKRWAEARTILERALAVGPRDPAVNYSLGMVYAQTGDTAQGYQYLRQALQLRPAYPEALNNLGVLYLRTGRRDEAVATFEECIRVAPEFDQSYLNLARVHSIEGQPEKARALLLELLKQHPDNTAAQHALNDLR
jgi:tetratricopeptide (TPR) repeat protein